MVPKDNRGARKGDKSFDREFPIPTPEIRHTVLGLNCPENIQGAVASIVSSLKGVATFLTAQFAEAATTASNHSISLVWMNDEPTFGSEVLRLIRSCTNQGLKVLAFGRDLRGWPLRSRCLPLLAGATSLLDTQQPNFSDELKSWVLRSFEAEAGREAENNRLGALMAELKIVGDSRTMLRLFENVRRISVLSDLTVLITGDSGTGKECLARAIHKLDPKRSSGPFVPLNCAALATNLAEAELFGHRKGSFTGASRDRRGVIRAAHGGVLFLDEIGELDSMLQGKLLRFLQESRVLAIGEDQESFVSVRVVAATNRNLKEMVKARTFRADLFHRLSVLALHVPPLSERRGDVPGLVRFFVRKNEHLAGCSEISIGSDFIEALTQTELPGNVRQLENIVRQCLLNKSANSALTLSDLPPEVWQQLSGSNEPSDSGKFRDLEKDLPPLPTSVEHDNLDWLRVLEKNGGDLERCLAWCERSLLQATLRRTSGNQSQTARLLGITPRCVYNKVRKHHLSEP